MTAGQRESVATLRPVNPTAGETPRVSVVLPVYNTRQYLADCLDSLVAQDVAEGVLEVVAVDDGSTDGSGELLDEYAARHPFLRVFHQENSGWPGQPRNRGIEESRGEYVLFVDSDDWLGAECIRRLDEFVREHGSDVVVPRIVSTSAPPGKRKAWRTAVDADLRRVFKTLSPQKLFRREFVEEHGLRFPEGEVRLEDGIFVTHAYLLGRRVSLLGGYDYYFKRRRDDGSNISFRPVDPEGYVSSLRRIAENVRALCPDEELAARLVLLIYNRKGLTRLVKGRRYARSKPEFFAAWVNALAGFAEAYVPAKHEKRLPAKRRELARAVRARDVSRAAADARSLGSIRAQIHSAAQREGLVRALRRASRAVRARSTSAPMRSK